MVGSDGLRSWAVGVEETVGVVGRGAVEASVDADGYSDDPLQVVGQVPRQELVLHRLSQPVEEGIHQGPSLPAAVRCQRLEVYGVVSNSVVPLAETQQLSTGLAASPP